MDGGDKIEVVQGDITKQDTDAIVNAAKESLTGGGGGDGAIHRAAGPALLAECLTLGCCPTGEARITKGYDLAARHVIHTVGPVWRGGHEGEDEALAACYRNSLALAEAHRVRTIAFPSISTGAYGFPFDRASRIAVREARAHLDRGGVIERIVFVCFSAGDARRTLDNLDKQDSEGGGRAKCLRLDINGLFIAVRLTERCWL